MRLGDSKFKRCEIDGLDIYCSSKRAELSFYFSKKGNECKHGKGRKWTNTYTHIHTHTHIYAHTLDIYKSGDFTPTL